MAIRYRPEGDVLYLLFAEGEEAYFDEPIPGVHVEYEGRDNVIEILNASDVLQDSIQHLTN